MENRRDRLEEYFRKKLEGQSGQPSQSGWDLPSENVWQSIEEKIDPAKASGFRYWLVALLLLLAGMVLWQWIAYRNEVNRLRRQVEKQTVAIEQLQSEIDEKETSLKLSEENMGKPARQKESYEETATLSTSKKGIRNNDAENFTGFSNPVQKNHESDSLQASTTGEGNETSSQIFDASIQITGLENQSAKTIQPTPELLGTSFPPLSYFSTLPALSSKSVSTQASSKWIISAYFSPAYTFRSVHKNVQDVTTPYEKTESPKFSYTAGVLAGKAVNARWRIYSGVNYQRFHQASRHTIGLRYKTDGAVPGPNGPENTYQTDLQTSFGDASVEVRVANDSQSSEPDVNEGRPFPVRFTADLELQHLGIPVLVEYRIGSERLALAIKGGLVGSFLLSKELEITDVRSLHPRLISRGVQISGSRVLAGIKDFSLDFQLSAGLQAKLTEHLGFILEPAYRQSISPVFENERFDTRLFSLALHSGLTCAF